MVRTERESERRREMADLLLLPRPAESLQNGTSFSGKTDKNERLVSAPQSKQLARTPEPPLEKEQSHLSRSPNCKMEESRRARVAT